MDNDMYFGSIRFFKHLIISVLVLSVSAFILLFSWILHSNILSEPQILVAAPMQKNSVGENDMPREVPQDSDVKYGSKAVHIETGAPAITDPHKPYQRLFPQMYCVKPTGTIKRDRVIYLTFDDGPSPLSGEILDILKKNDVKATFFLVGKTDEFSLEIIKRIVAEGHAIGIHAYTHKYEKIYRSVDTYLEDFNKIYNHIYSTTGIKADIFRFPGGSVNEFNKDVYKDIIAEMTRRGFTYYDWNVSFGEALVRTGGKNLTKYVIHAVSLQEATIILFHDYIFEPQTLPILDEIIKKLKSDGYAFDRLTNTVKPVVFKK